MDQMMYCSYLAFKKRLIMKTIVENMWQSREEASQMLGRRLANYRNSSAVVVGLLPGGVGIASAIARELSLPLEVLPCKVITHPGNGQVLGSVCSYEVFVRECSCSYDIPQDYILHQVALLRNAIRYENSQYYGERSPSSFSDKTVILVDDSLRWSDAIAACVRGIRKQGPAEIVVATPVVTADAARVISAEADEIVFLRREAASFCGTSYFLEASGLGPAEVKSLLEAS